MLQKALFKRGTSSLNELFTLGAFRSVPPFRIRPQLVRRSKTTLGHFEIRLLHDAGRLEKAY